MLSKTKVAICVCVVTLLSFTMLSGCAEGKQKDTSHQDSTASISKGESIPSSSKSKSEKRGVTTVTTINSPSELPDKFMNEAFKSAVGLVNKPFRESGLSMANAEVYGEVVTFGLDGLEFLGKPCEKDYGKPCISYDLAGVQSGDGLPQAISFSYANPLKSNGHKETMEIIDGIGDALGLKDYISIENDYTDLTKIAVGRYCTVVFPDAGFKMEVRNTDGTVRIEIEAIE